MQGLFSVQKYSAPSGTWHHSQHQHLCPGCFAGHSFCGLQPKATLRADSLVCTTQLLLIWAITTQGESLSANTRFSNNRTTKDQSSNKGHTPSRLSSENKRPFLECFHLCLCLFKEKTAWVMAGKTKTESCDKHSVLEVVLSSWETYSYQQRGNFACLSAHHHRRAFYLHFCLICSPISYSCLVWTCPYPCKSEFVHHRPTENLPICVKNTENPGRKKQATESHTLVNFRSVWIEFIGEGNWI